MDFVQNQNYWNHAFLSYFRCLQDQDVLQTAMSTLDDEIAPWDDPSEASVEYRKNLTKSLLYKVLHTIKSKCFLYPSNNFVVQDKVIILILSLPDLFSCTWRCCVRSSIKKLSPTRASKRR